MYNYIFPCDTHAVMLYIYSMHIYITSIIKFKVTSHLLVEKIVVDS